MLVPTLIEHGTEAQKQHFVARHAARQDHLVPGLQRARRRQRPRLAAHPRRARRRPLGGQRPEDLDLERQRGRLDVRARAHRARRAEARRHQLPADRHEDARHRRAAAAPDDRRRRLQRGVLRQRARAEGEHRRRARPGLDGQPLDAQARARADRQRRRSRAAPSTASSCWRRRSNLRGQPAIKDPVIRDRLVAARGAPARRRVQRLPPAHEQRARRGARARRHGDQALHARSSATTSRSSRWT